VSTSRPFLTLLGLIPSCSALSTTVPRSRTPSTPLDASGSPKWLPGLFLRRGAFASSMRSLLTLLGHSWGLWKLPGTAVSPSGLSGSPQALSGESSRLLRFERLRSCSDAFRRFFGCLQSSSTLPDAADTSASSPGSSGSTRVLPGEYFRPFGFERLLTRTDMSSSFIGRFRSSWSRPGAPDASASPLTRSTSQLEAAHLSPLSSTLGDWVRRCAGLSDAVGELFDSRSGRLGC
jgi:hypothetical protein